MRFLKLLDPRAVVAEGPGLSIRDQAANARERFPDLVSESAFDYWRLGDALVPSALRLLVGVSPTFDLSNLRLLDLLQDKLSSEHLPGLQLDVFDLDDMGDWPSATHYFPGVDRMVPNPIVGIWTLGIHVTNYWGGNATAYLLSAFDIRVTAQQLAESVRPPSPDMLG